MTASWQLLLSQAFIFNQQTLCRKKPPVRKPNIWKPWFVASFVGNNSQQMLHSVSGTTLTSVFWEGQQRTEKNEKVNYIISQYACWARWVCFLKVPMTLCTLLIFPHCKAGGYYESSSKWRLQSDSIRDCEEAQNASPPLDAVACKRKHQRNENKQESASAKLICAALETLWVLQVLY